MKPASQTSQMATRVRARRFCLLLSYCGKNYFGMQRNANVPTIEESLFCALRDTGLIKDEEFHRPQLVAFQRAARTDRGVSAIRQIVSIKLPESISTRVSEVNEKLPLDIRLMGLTVDSYRVTNSVLENFNQILEGFKGSHNFHNYTSGKKFADDSSVRVIRHISCGEPFFPCDQNDVEFVVVRVKGQSFMLHQIRKMIGMAIAVARGLATEDQLRRSMEKEQIDIPKAPGLGLLLENVHYDRYNRKFGKDGTHEPLLWSDCDDKVNDFKGKYIYKIVVDTEREERSMFNWLNILYGHTYEGEEPTFQRCLDDKLSKPATNLEEQEQTSAADQPTKTADQVTEEKEPDEPNADEQETKRLKMDKDANKVSV